MKTFLRILAYARPYSGLLTGHILTAVLSVLFGGLTLTLLQPVLNILFFEDPTPNTVLQEAPSPGFSVDALKNYLEYQLQEVVREEGKQTALLGIILILVGGNILANLFRFLSAYFIIIVRHQIVYDLRRQVFQHVSGMRVSFFDTHRKGDLMTRITTDIEEIERSVVDTFKRFVKEPAQLLFLLYLMISFSGQLTLFVLAVLPFTALIISLVAKKLRREARDAQGNLGLMSSVVDEVISGMRVVKAFRGEGFIRGLFDRYNDRVTRLLKRYMTRRNIIPPFSETMGVLSVGAVLWYGGALVFSGQMQASGFITYIILFSQLLSPAKQLARAFSNITKGIASADRVFELLDTPQGLLDRPQARPIHALSDGIRLENMSFAYEEGQPVLQRLNLYLEKGKTYALVGPSGCGKSTLAELLLRFYDPTEGRILVDGVDLRALRTSEWRALIGLVTQEPILFHDTIYNNIAFGASGVSNAAVYEAARAAHAQGFIEQLPQGFETTVGERGVMLSGGQKQRVSIARAILQDPEILILDEATSALDTESERMVQQALQSLMQGRTSLVIAHRLSTIQDADQILAMDRGRIVEQGRHPELLGREGLYRRLHEMQQLGSE